MDNMSNIDQALTKLDKRLERIENALLGDEELGHFGMAKRLDITERKVEELEDRLSKVLLLCIGAGAGSAGLTEFFVRMML